MKINIVNAETGKPISKKEILHVKEYVDSMVPDYKELLSGGGRDLNFDFTYGSLLEILDDMVFSNIEHKSLSDLEKLERHFCELMSWGFCSCPIVQPYLGAIWDKMDDRKKELCSKPMFIMQESEIRQLMAEFKYESESCSSDDFEDYSEELFRFLSLPRFKQQEEIEHCIYEAFCDAKRDLDASRFNVNNWEEELYLSSLDVLDVTCVLYRLDNYDCIRDLGIHSYLTNELILVREAIRARVESKYLSTATKY